MNPLLYSLIFAGLVLILPIYSWLLSWLIPDKWVEVYKKKLDIRGDILVSAFSMVGMGFLMGIVAQSHFTNGGVWITAVEYRESGFELIMLSILLLLFVVHLALQLKIFRRNLG